ncbi:MAG: hypothetical protein H7Z21_20360, partial [Hymenobacter sp.]|nr:hypothetical protein [Hymenobacter sp.]
MKFFSNLLPLRIVVLALGLWACNKQVVDPKVVVTPPTPVLTVAPAGLAAFSTQVGRASAAQSFTVGGTALTGSISVGVPAGYEVALTPDAGYAPAVAVSSAAVTAV